ncbi:MAG: ABC transporter ATP-binding protein [Phototrophicaceae bacterium]
MKKSPINLGTIIVKGWQGTLPDNQQAAVDTIVEESVENKRQIFLSAILNILAAFLEANAIGFITIGLTIGMGESFSDELESFGAIGIFLADTLANFSSEQIVIIMISLGILSQVVRSTLFFGARFATITLQTTVEASIQKKLFEKYMRMPYKQITKYSVGDLYATFNFAAHLATVFYAINSGFGLIASILFYGTLMFLLSWQLAIGGVILFGSLAIIVLYINGRIQLQFQEYIAASKKMSENNNDFLNSTYEIHAMNREDYVIDFANEAIEKSQHAQRRGLFWTSLSRPVAEVFSIIGLAVFALIGFNLAQSSIENVNFLPRLIAFVIILFRVMMYGNQFNASLALIFRYWASFEEVGKMLALETSFIDYSGDSFQRLNSDIQFDAVSFSYAEDEEDALRNISFTIPFGKKTAIVGESGSGKSSIVHLLLRIHEPTQGTVRVNGESLTDFNQKDWRERIALVSQTPSLYNMSVKENIRYGNLEATDEQIIEASKVAFADNFIEAMPNGYDTPLIYRGTNMSGGERQRIAIARAYIRTFDLLILDEATSALDSRTESLVQKNLFEGITDKTVVAVAHRLTTIKDADLIIVLQHGKVVEQGTHDDLLALNGEYATFWDIQSGAEQEDSIE